MSGPIDKPAAEVDLTVSLVRALLEEQHPDLAHLPIEPIGSGWDNALFRLGADLLARLPRRELSVPLVAHEVRWLPELAPHLPLPVPVPVRLGEPGCGYPWPWTIVPHLPGASALATPPRDLGAAAEALAGFVVAMHRPAPPDAPENPYRGVPLSDRTERTEGWIEQLASMIDAGAARAAWREAVALPGWDGPPLWLHGDLHPNNVVVHEGRVGGIIDFGDLTSGDPATDLAIAWMLLDVDARAAFRRRVGVDGTTWARGRGWALTLGLAYLAHARDDEAFGRVGLATIEACLADR
ncbi:MAG: aminoglycoside phosphotransferase family protein [Acidimicrobiales bacterium]